MDEELGERPLIERDVCVPENGSEYGRRQQSGEIGDKKQTNASWTKYRKHAEYDQCRGAKTCGNERIVDEETRQKQNCKACHPARVPASQGDTGTDNGSNQGEWPEECRDQNVDHLAFANHRTEGLAIHLKQ